MPQIRNNLRAAVPPSVHDGAAAQYAKGSHWFDHAARTLWICADPAAGAAIWHPLQAPVLAQQAYADAAAPTLTGSTAETAMGPSIVVPGNAMGANGRLRVTTLWTATNNANAKTVKAKFGGTAYLTTGVTGTAALRHQFEIANTGDTSAQMGALSGGSGGWSTTAVGPVASALDTTQDQALAFTGQLANAGDTLKLRGYLVEVFYGA